MADIQNFEHPAYDSITGFMRVTPQAWESMDRDLRRALKDRAALRRDRDLMAAAIQEVLNNRLFRLLFPRRAKALAAFTDPPKGEAQ